MPKINLLILLLQIFATNFVNCKKFDNKKAISVINGYRKLHLGEGHSLKQDAELQAKAEKSVKEAVSNEGFPGEVSAGQNVYQVCASFGVKISPKQVIKAWYDEVCSNMVDFDEGVFDNAESFSQLVWQDTSLVGLATKNGLKGNQTCKYISAFFRPPGNIDGFYKENVKLGKLERDEYCDNL